MSADALLSIIVPLWIGSVGAAAKFRSDAQGWKTSYQREKERADRQDQIARDNALAEGIANKLLGGLGKLMAPKVGDTS